MFLLIPLVWGAGSPPGMFEWGSKRGVGSGGPPPGEKKIRFLNSSAENGIFQLKCQRNIENIFIFFTNKRGYSPLVLSGGGGSS